MEALVSLALLTTALVPTFILATDAIRLSGRIRNSLIASSLAQEGVEVVRALRDANWFAGQPFDTGLTLCVQGCQVAWDSPSLTPVKNMLPLKWDKPSGLYQYSAGTDSPFSRTIIVTPGSGNAELVVKSEVTWAEHAIPKSVVVEYHLFDWTK